MAHIFKRRLCGYLSKHRKHPLQRLALPMLLVTKNVCLATCVVALLAASAAGSGIVEVRGRPFHLRVPASYNGSRPVPLVVLLHGLQVTSTYQETYMRIGDAAEANGIIFAYPDGTRGPAGPFWNGAGCCQDPLTPPVDDVGYIGDIINYARTRFRLDGGKIFLIGHSNGAFMASRYVCERSDVAAIVTMSGGQYRSPFACNGLSFSRTSVLHIHGTNDEIVPYGEIGTAPGLGALIGVPTALATMMNWSFRNSCTYPLGRSLPDRDLDSTIPGTETSGVEYGCFHPGVALELWTMRGAPHVPTFYQTPSQSFGHVALEWLLRHGRS